MFESPPPSVRAPSLGRQKAILWLAFLVITAVSLLAFLSTRQLIALSGRVERTQNILVETNRYLSDLKDVENGGRGYYLTGDDRYLRTQRQGIADARATASRLRGLRDSTDLGQRLDRLFALAAERIEFSQMLVAQRVRPAAARQSIVLGGNLMDRINAAGDRIIASQTQSYRQDRLELERQARLTSLAFAVGVALCLAAIAWLFAIRGREVERRRRL